MIQKRALGDALQEFSSSLFDEFFPSWSLESVLECSHRLPLTVAKQSTKNRAVSNPQFPATIPIGNCNHFYCVIIMVQLQKNKLPISGCCFFFCFFFQRNGSPLACCSFTQPYYWKGKEEKVLAWPAYPSYFLFRFHLSKILSPLMIGSEKLGKLSIMLRLRRVVELKRSKYEELKR